MIEPHVFYSFEGSKVGVLFKVGFHSKRGDPSFTVYYIWNTWRKFLFKVLQYIYWTSERDRFYIITLVCPFVRYAIDLKNRSTDFPKLGMKSRDNKAWRGGYYSTKPSLQTQVLPGFIKFEGQNYIHKIWRLDKGFLPRFSRSSTKYFSRGGMDRIFILATPKFS